MYPSNKYPAFQLPRAQFLFVLLLLFCFFGPSVSTSVISALIFPILIWRIFALAAAHLSTPDLIDLKILDVKKDFVSQS